MFGLSAFGKVGAAIRGAFAALWSPASLFSAGEQGAWYDPSDLSTMFQDRAGTTPVTADGQTVGLILDKSKGLVLGSELVTNGGFSGVVDGTDVTTLTGWSAYGSPTYRDIQGEQLRIVSTGNGQGAILTVSTVVGKYYNIRFNAYGSISGVSGVYCPDVGSLAFASGSLDAKVKASGTTMLFYFRTGDDSPGTVYFDNISVKELSGNHAVAPSDAARPLYKTDGTYHWLQFDGVDDSLSTAAIDFTATDKMSVFSGIYRAVASPDAMAFEFGSGIQQGAFYLTAPEGSNRFGISAFSTYAYSQFFNDEVAPTTRVITTNINLGSTDPAVRIAARINAVARTHDASGGIIGSPANFGNYLFYIGSRAGTSLRFNGRIYSLIVRGAQSTTQEITDTETWVNSKTGAY